MTNLAQELRSTIRYPAVRFSAALALVMLLTVVATSAFLWWPATSEYDRMTREVARSRSEIIHAINQAKTTENFHGTQKLVDAISDKLEATVSQAALTEHMNRLAAELGIKILNESNEKGKITLDYRPMIQELSIKGGYAAIRRFLLAMNTLPTWTIVQELRVTRKNVTSDLKAVITLVTYRQVTREGPGE